MANAAPDTVAAPARLVPVKLVRNYRPMGTYEVVGWDKPAIEVKDPAGILRTIEEAKFVEGEAAPPPYSGVGSGERVWSGTTIRVPAEEAKAMKKAGIGEIEVD